MSEATMTISDWEARALKAESEVARLKAEARSLGEEIRSLKDRLGEYEDEEEECDEIVCLERAEAMWKKAEFLLALDGALLITGMDRFFLERVIGSLAGNLDGKDEEWVEKLFEGREREAALRGEAWTWEGGAL